MDDYMVMLTGIKISILYEIRIVTTVEIMYHSIIRVIDIDSLKTLTCVKEQSQIFGIDPDLSVTFGCFNGTLEICSRGRNSRRRIIL